MRINSKGFGIWVGLAIRKITTFNQALIGKWLWGSDGEGSYSWRCVVAAQCGELGAGWSTLDVHKPHGCSLRKGVRAG